MATMKMLLADFSWLFDSFDKIDIYLWDGCVARNRDYEKIYSRPIILHYHFLPVLQSHVQFILLRY